MTDFVVQGTRLISTRFIAGGSVAPPAAPQWASPVFEQSIPPPPGGGTTVNWGFKGTASLDEDGNTMVASIRDDGLGYIFTRSGTTWTQTKALTANTASSAWGSTNGVDISGDGKIVAFGDTTNDKVEIYFQSDNYTTPQILNTFGDPAVQISRNSSYLAVGMRLNGVQQRGAMSFWSLGGSPQTYTAAGTYSGASPNNQNFGTSVGISEDGLTAMGGGDPGLGTSGAYRQFRNATGPPGGSFSEDAGSTFATGSNMQQIDVSGDFSVVANTGGTDNIRVVRHTTTSTVEQEQTIDTGASSGADKVTMGAAGKLIAFGVTTADPGSPQVVNAGEVHIWEADDIALANPTWSFLTTITPPTPTTNGVFGSTVKFSDDGMRLLIGETGGDNIHVYRASNAPT